jgi:c(7)-type cytochrome triheme protein
MTGRRERPHKPKVVFGVAGFLLLAAGSQGQQQLPPPAPQPVPYSHKTHLALGLKCDSCHRNADPGEYMGFPPESFCMGCHQVIKADSPHIEKVAAAAREKKPIAWVRVYQLPNFVYFSHRVHTAAGATCERCHGPVRERAVITREVLHNMASCIACHAASKARNDCGTCHEERH